MQWGGMEKDSIGGDWVGWAGMGWEGVEWVGLGRDVTERCGSRF